MESYQKYTVRINKETYKRMRKLAIDLDTTVKDLLLRGFEKIEQEHCTSSAKNEKEDK